MGALSLALGLGLTPSAPPPGDAPPPSQNTRVTTNGDTRVSADLNTRVTAP